MSLTYKSDRLTTYKSRLDYEANLTLNIKKDIDGLLKALEEENDLSYKTFAKIWTTMKFSFIYCGLKNALHARVYVTQVFKYIQRRFLIEPLYNKQLLCFYTMYGLYYKQPIEHLIKYRFSLNDWKIYNAFKQQSRDKRQVDALYVAYKLESDSAFYHVAFPNIFAPNVDNRKYAEEVAQQPETSEKFYMELNKILNSCDGLDDLEKTCLHYEQKKNEYKKSSGNDNLVFFNTSIGDDIKNLLSAMHLEDGGLKKRKT